MPSETSADAVSRRRHHALDAYQTSGSSPPLPSIPSLTIRRVRAEPPARISLTPTEAAAAIGVSRSFFYEHVLPELRVIRIGRKRLVPVAELASWTHRSACLTLEH